MENRIVHVRNITISRDSISLSSYYDTRYLSFYNVEVETYNGIMSMFWAFRYEYFRDIGVYLFYDENNRLAHLFTADSVFIEG